MATLAENVLARSLAARAALVEHDLAHPQGCKPAKEPDCSECGGSKTWAAWVSLTRRCQSGVHS